MSQLEDTFVGWAAQNRSVKQGERARFYLVDPNDPTVSRALFAIDQTEPLTDEPVGTWERITTEEYRARRDALKKAAKDTRPIVKLDWNPETKVMRIWCGRHPDVIRGLKAGLWRFDMTTHRWIKSGVDPIEVAQKLDKLGVKLEVEGFPFEQLEV